MVRKSTKKSIKSKKSSNTEAKIWSWSLGNACCTSKQGHFFGGLLFGTTLLWILNIQGVITPAVPVWLQVMLVLGFAFLFN